jgi:hypothetical protein
MKVEGQMDTASERSGPILWPPHPNFSDRVNSNIIQSEIEGGVHLKEVAPRTSLIIQTQNRAYTMVVLDERRVLISGHPEFCDQPTEVHVLGSTWGGSMIWQGFIGRGMFLEFHHPVYEIIRTSRILDIRCAEDDRFSSSENPLAA